MSYRGEDPDVTPASGPERKPRLLGEVRARLRAKRYSLRAEQAYLYWIKRFVRESGLRHPRDLGGLDVEGFLSRLAVRHHVAASTQNQALAAVLFLYREVLQLELPWMENVIHAKSRRRLPVMLAKSEVLALLDQLGGREALIADLLYGSDLRLLEYFRLRITDMDLARNGITVRKGKDIGTTQIYTHVPNRGPGAALSPLDC